MDRLTLAEVHHLFTGVHKVDGQSFINPGWHVSIKLAIFSAAVKGSNSPSVWETWTLTTVSSGCCER